MSFSILCGKMLSTYYSEFLIDAIRLELKPLQWYNFRINLPAALALLVWER